MDGVFDQIFLFIYHVREYCLFSMCNNYVIILALFGLCFTMRDFHILKISENLISRKLKIGYGCNRCYNNAPWFNILLYKTFSHILFQWTIFVSVLLRLFLGLNGFSYRCKFTINTVFWIVSQWLQDHLTSYTYHKHMPQLAHL